MRATSAPLDRLTRTLRLPGGAPFASLWAALSISVFGDQVTAVAVPTIAILALGVGPFEAGLLAAASWIAWPILGPVAGVWVDRLPRRPVLVVCDLARMILLLSIPVAVALGGVGFPQLLVVVFGAGVANLFFDLAFTSHLPELVEPSAIPLANARIEASRSTSYVAGPSLAGALISIIGAPAAVIVDAVTFLASATLIRSAPAVVRSTATAVATGVGAVPRKSVRAELIEGFAVLRLEPILLRLILAAALSNFGLVAARAILLLHLYRDLGFTPAFAGLVLAAPGIGALLGVAAARALAVRIGVGRTLLAATVLESVVWLAIPIASGPLAGLVIAVALAASSFWGLVWNVIAASVRQVAVPSNLLGRTGAIRGAIGFGVIPIGGVAGGAIATALASAGLPALPLTIGIGALVGVSSGLMLVGQRIGWLRTWRFGEPWRGALAPTAAPSGPTKAPPT
jgi:MFS family permease